MKKPSKTVERKGSPTPKARKKDLIGVNLAAIKKQLHELRCRINVLEIGMTCLLGEKLEYEYSEVDIPKFAVCTISKEAIKKARKK